jgi:hypothetical protein
MKYMKNALIFSDMNFKIKRRKEKSRVHNNFFKPTTSHISRYLFPFHRRHPYDEK